MYKMDLEGALFGGLRGCTSVSGLATSALEVLPQPVIIYDTASLDIVYANDAAVTLYGWPRSELQQLSLKALRPVEDPPALQARYGGGHWEHRRQDGSLMTVRVMSQPLPCEAGELRVAVISDETAFAAASIADAEGQQQERLAALRDLAGQAAHQGRNPLGSVVALAHCLLALPALGENPEARRDLDTIVTEAQRAAAALHDLLAVTRAADPSWDPVQVSRIVLRATSERIAAWNQLGITLHQELDPNVPCVLVDRARLADMVRLLISNAEHGMRVSGGEIRITLQSRSRQVVLTIQDEGPGLPEDLCQRLSGPDEELLPVASEPASAIPTLMEVKAWARAAGGWFAAGNSPMGGARITLTLPAVRLASDALVQSVASGGPAAYGAGGAVPAGSAYSVLYADENLARRSNACLDLGEDGRFAVSHAPTSELAGVLLNDGGFDVIVVDLEDPANDGDELWRFLGETAPHVLSRILFTVGDGTSPAARRFLSRAGRPWLQRPVTASTLAALTAAIGRSTVVLPEPSQGA